MDAGFWHDKWEKGEIGFHLSQVHPLLKRFLPALHLSPGQRIFVPLCGKSLDLGYLLDQGLEVVGAELSDKAIIALFEQLGMEPEVEEWAAGKCYQHGNLRVFQGDIFALDTYTLGQVDAIYDRAALIALPDGLRQRYAEHLVALTDRAAQLLITLSYQQQQMDGPPFSVGPQLVSSLYGQTYAISALSDKNIITHEPRFAERGLTALHEQCCLLTPL